MSLSQRDSHAQENLLLGLARGEYHLLLGAGARVGAPGGDGRPLPTAATLTAELLLDFGFGVTTEEVTLREAYDAVESRVDTHGRNRAQYIAARFSSCTPTWHTLLPRFSLASDLDSEHR